MDKDSFSRHTNLPSMEERSKSALESSSLNVSVLANNRGRFATKFHDYGLQIFASHGGNDGSDVGGASEV